MKKSLSIRQPVHKGVAKVPVILQMEARECGAASLAMVLAYYQKWVPLTQVREDCGVSRDGSSAGNVVKAARSYGLNAEGFRMEPESLREEGLFPCIIHWNFNHFVVLCGFKGESAVICDPAKGTYRVTKEEFDKSFTGICLMFEPGDSFEPSGKPKSVVEFAKEKLIGAGAAFKLVVITTMITSLIGIITPGMMSIFVDRLLPGVSPEWFLPFMISMTALAAVQIITEWIRTVYSLKVNGKIAVVGNSEYMWHVLRMPMHFFSQRMTGDISMRRQLNASIAEQLIDTYAPLVIQSFMMIFYLVVMLRYSWIMSLLGILSVFLSTMVSTYVSKKRLNIMRAEMRDEGLLAGHTVAGVEMIESIKSSGSENGFFEKWAGYQANVNTGRIRTLKFSTYLGAIPMALTEIVNVLVLMGSVYLCMKGLWTVGMISAFAGFLSSFLSPASQMVQAVQKIQEMRSNMERIDDVMKYPVDVEYSSEELPEDADFGKLSGKLEMRNVTFGYSRLSEPLIRNFSMTIDAGKQVAFVGPSGCGKSTLSKLITGLYQPWSGEILFDGKPISEINRNVFTGSVSVVDQEITLFEDTIANNIKMWDTSIEDFEMVLAARDAQIHDDIMERDEGYQSKLTEGGRDLSGGQRQRLEIARVLAADPTLLILDEATSALDARTEHRVVQSIRNRGISCVVIAHRLSTVRDCDEIIVLDHGTAVERGSHKELCGMGGVYADLVSNE